MRRLGVPRPPAVAVGDRVVHGWNPEEYARLVGVDYAAASKLPPRALGARLDAILAAAQDIIRILPADRMSWKPPERDRSIGDLAFHVFRVGGSFADAMDLGALPETWFGERTPADLPDGEALARYGALVRGRLAGWLEGAANSEFDRIIKCYYGPQGAHEFLERTTWHAAQHLRQIYWFLDRMGVQPDSPLGEPDLAGLPIPQDVWS